MTGKRVARKRRIQQESQRKNLIAGAVLLIGVTVALVGYLTGKATQGEIATQVSIPDSSPADLMNFLADGLPYLGADDAPVVIVEFSDYYCPFCGKFYLETLPSIIENYPTEVKYVHRNYPFSGDSSYHIALASACADEQGQFWELNDILFSFYFDFDTDFDHSQPPPAGDREKMFSYFSDENILSYAQEIGLDMDAFASCMEEEHASSSIETDYAIAREIGIQSIPFYIINGKAAVGFRTYEEFQPLIVQALAEANAQ